MVTRKILNEENVRELLRDEVERAGGQSAWARGHKVERSFLNRVLIGRKGISRKILSELKIKTVYILEK